MKCAWCGHVHALFCYEANENNELKWCGHYREGSLLVCEAVIDW